MFPFFGYSSILASMFLFMGERGSIFNGYKKEGNIDVCVYFRGGEDRRPTPKHCYAPLLVTSLYINYSLIRFNAKIT